MILPGAAPLRQFLFGWAMTFQVVEKMAQTVLPQCDAALFGALAFHDNQAVFAIKVACAQPTQLG